MALRGTSHPFSPGTALPQGGGNAARSRVTFRSRLFSTFHGDMEDGHGRFTCVERSLKKEEASQ